MYCSKAWKSLDQYRKTLDLESVDDDKSKSEYKNEG